MRREVVLCRVTLDISLPLCRGRVVTLENRNKVLVSFEHERLPKICYCTMIRIVLYGFKAKVPCLLTKDNTCVPVHIL